MQGQWMLTRRPMWRTISVILWNSNWLSCFLSQSSVHTRSSFLCSSDSSSLSPFLVFCCRRFWFHWSWWSWWWFYSTLPRTNLSCSNLSCQWLFDGDSSVCLTRWCLHLLSACFPLLWICASFDFQQVLLRFLSSSRSKPTAETNRKQLKSGNLQVMQYN